MIEKNIYIEKENGKKIFVNVLENGIEAPNVIYIQTPISSVVELKECYFPLSEYGLNVFSIDLSGIGKSDGEVKDFSVATINEDINTCVKYIKQNYTNNIHFFGGTGIGGVLGQHYVSESYSIKSFVQYGLANYKDVTPLGNSLIIRIIYPLLSLIKIIIPNLSLKFNPPKYNGKNAEKENKWYEEEFGDMNINISFFKTLLDIVLSKKSNIKVKPKCPVLIFAPKHDRYYSMAYIKKYYNWLDKPKKLYKIDDSHLSFLWHAEEICHEASKWFNKYSK